MNALGQLEEHRVGFGDQLQMTVPANTWFAAKAHEESSFSLVSCTVAPGFDFADFELGRRQQLLDQFGDTEANRAIITQLTRQ
jgi:predicted cupin superfamily sugar epimerase